MKALVSGAVRISDAAKVMGLMEQQERSDVIMKSLLEDGLIAQVKVRKRAISDLMGGPQFGAAL